MIHLYSWATPNGEKLHIMMEELGIPYELHRLDIGKGEQFEPQFLKLSPNNKIPVLVDTEGPDGEDYVVFETGAMLMYLAEKTGKFMPQDMAARYSVIQWLMFQMGGIGPMFGQYSHFTTYAPETFDYSVERYTKECMRLYGVMDRRLGETKYLAGDEYTIADIATYAWTYSWERRGFDISEFKNVQRWLDDIGARPAVQRGTKLLGKPEKPDAETLKNYFGDEQYERR
ncbi:MAG: glutathione binding-like protein [Alphaproteobacteria bacterium]